jgi:HNH endonuclease
MGMHNRIDWPIEEMTQWYKSGMTLQQIGDRLGRDLRLVHKALKKAGIEMRPRGWSNQSGSRNVSWNGGRTIDKHGYVLLRKPDHPAADRRGYVREHRLVAEQALGRLLKPDEVVHHKNDDPSDNRPENLMVYETNAQHLSETLRGKVPQWTEEGRQRTLEGTRRPRKPVATLDLSASGDDLWKRMFSHLTK